MQQISADFKYLSGERYLLVPFDDYCRYPTVEFATSVSAPRPVVIPRCHKILAEFVVLAQVRTDNGPKFNGKGFKSFGKSSRFNHRKMSPKWPQPNGEVERFIRRIKETIEAAIVEHGPWKQELHDRQAVGHSVIQQYNE